MAPSAYDLFGPALGPLSNCFIYLREKFRKTPSTFFPEIVKMNLTGSELKDATLGTIVNGLRGERLSYE